MAGRGLRELPSIWGDWPAAKRRKGLLWGQHLLLEFIILLALSNQIADGIGPRLEPTPAGAQELAGQYAAVGGSVLI